VSYASSPSSGASEKSFPLSDTAGGRGSETSQEEERQGSSPFRTEVTHGLSDSVDEGELGCSMRFFVT